jgi:hypothetical protein
MNVATSLFPGTAHLKFRHPKRQIPFRNFKWKSGTGFIGLLVVRF